MRIQVLKADSISVIDYNVVKNFEVRNNVINNHPTVYAIEKETNGRRFGSKRKRNTFETVIAKE